MVLIVCAVVFYSPVTRHHDVQYIDVPFSTREARAFSRRYPGKLSFEACEHLNEALEIAYGL